MELFKFHKRKNLVSLKLSAIWGNLTLHHSCLLFPQKSPFLQFAKAENVHGHIFEKIFLEEWKEGDEHFANHLQMYVSRTFTKAKKSVICSEYPMSSKFYLSKWKTYFSQFIDKFLKIEEVEYLIHYVKFKMWPALFYVNSLCFPNIFECWC